MCTNAGSHSVGVDFRLPVIFLKQLLSSISNFLEWMPWDQSGPQYSAALYIKAMADILKMFVLQPQADPASFPIKLFQVVSICCRKVKVRSSFISRYFCASAAGIYWPHMFSLRVLLA